MTETRDTIEILDAAWTYLDQGFRLIPLVGKVPAGDLLPLVDGRPSWKPYLKRRTTREEIRRLRRSDGALPVLERAMCVSAVE